MDWKYTLVVLVALVAGCGPTVDVGSLPAEAVTPQRVAGIWEGAIEPSGPRLVIRVSNDNGVLTATIDSPDQGVFGHAVDDVRFDGRRFAFAVASLNATYLGMLAESGTSMTGDWRQRATFDLDLAKVDRPSRRQREQTPRAPFDYDIAEVEFAGGAAGVSLAGTLTTPRGSGVPAIVMVSGSGQQDRDGTLMGHTPFWVIADYLSRHGIAVLRYDERGVGESTGRFADATTEDFAADALQAIELLGSAPGIDPRRIGVLGHSEGGLVVALLAGRMQAPLSCGVTMAGPAVTGRTVHQNQVRMILEANTFPLPDSTIEKVMAMNAAVYAANHAEGTWVQRRAVGFENYRRAVDEFNVAERSVLTLDAESTAVADALVSPWFSFFLSYDPIEDFRAARIPLLALFGEKDLQVASADSVQALEGLNQRDRIDIRVFEDLNHLFQTASSGTPDEYAEIEQTVAPVVLEAIARWVKQRC